MLKMMKKLMFAFLVAFTAFLVVACNQECPEPEECPQVPECEKCEVCDECEECPEIPECKQDYVAPESFELYDDIVVVGVAKQLIYEDFSPKGAYEGLLWESSNEEYATVDQNGVVTGVRPGSVMIKATSVLNKEVYREVEIIVQDAVVDPFEVVKRETQYILSQIPVYAAADFDFPKPWNETVQVKFELDGVEVTKFEIPEGLTEDKALDYSLTISYGDNTVTENVKVWAVTDINVNAYTRVETAKQTAANLLAVYTVVGDKVSGDIALPEYIYGVKMNWNSSLRSALSAEGVYNRPLDDKTVTLDITCAYGAYSSTAAYSVVVKGYDADEKVDYILTEGSLAALNGAKVNTSLALPKYDSKFDVKLSYTSGNTAIYDNDGKLVAAPAEDTEVVFTVKAVYDISNGQNFEKEFELKVIATAENEASKAAEKWLAESGFNKEVHFPYGTEKGNVLDVPTAYEGAEVKWDVEGAKLYSKGHEAEVNAFELTEEGKPELVVQYLRYTQVQIKATFTAGEAKSEVVVLLNIGISASAENIYSGTWRNTAQKDGSLTVEQGLYDVANNVSYFDAPLSYAGDNYGGYMWSGYSFTVTTAEGKTYENFVMEYMTAYIREDANGNLYVDGANIYSGDGGNWGVFFVNTTNKEYKAEVGTYAASGNVFSDGVDCDNQGNRTGLTFDGYANGFVADATGKVLVGCQGGKLQSQIPSTDKTQFTSSSGSQYTASFVTIPAGGYGMSWKYQFYGVGVIAAISPYTQIGAQLTITKHDVHPLNDYDATQAVANLEAAESTIAMNDIANNASLENNIIKARNYYNALEGATKANVFAEERLAAAEAATAALIDAEIVALLADETADGFTTKLGQLYTRLNKLTEQVASKLTKKADFDARYDYYASIDLKITLDYDGGYAVGLYKDSAKKQVIDMFLTDLYAYLVAQGAFQKEIVDGVLVDNAALETPSYETFTTADYWANNYAKYSDTVLGQYLFEPAYVQNEAGEWVANENYDKVKEGSNKFFNQPEYNKWVALFDYVDEATRYANGAGQDAWGKVGENYAELKWLPLQSYYNKGSMYKDYSATAIPVTNSGTLLGAYRFAQYIAGASINANYKDYVPHNYYSATFDRQYTQENCATIIYHCTDGEVALPLTAYKAGYEFLGWYFEDGTKAVVTGAMFKDVTVKAKWLAKLETSIEEKVGAELEPVYYGDGGKNLWYQSTTPAGDLTTQNANVGIGNRAVVVDGKLFIMPKYALIELGKDATEDVTLKEKAELQPYGVDETQNSTGLIYDAATDTVKSQNSYGHGALYVNAGQKNVTIEAIELAYGRSTVSGTAFGYHKYVFELNAETGKYTAKLAGATGTVTLKPGDYLWCPMTADRFCSGLTDCDGTSGVPGVLADGKEIQVLDISGLVPAEVKWAAAEFIDAFDPENPVLISGQYLDLPAEFVVPAALKRSGYQFLGWNTDAQATEALTEINTTLTENVTYYAIWQKLDKFDAVTVDAAYEGDDPQTFKDIYSAINALKDNGTITVKAGDYSAETIAIAKPLTMVGPNATKHAGYTKRADEAILGAIEIADGLDGVVIKGFTTAGKVNALGNVTNLEYAYNNITSTAFNNFIVTGNGTNVNFHHNYQAVGSTSYGYRPWRISGVAKDCKFNDNILISNLQNSGSGVTDALYIQKADGTLEISGNILNYSGNNWMINLAGCEATFTELNVKNNKMFGFAGEDTSKYASGPTLRGLPATAVVNFENNEISLTAGTVVDIRGEAVVNFNNNKIDTAGTYRISGTTLNAKGNYVADTCAKNANGAFELTAENKVALEDYNKLELVKEIELGGIGMNVWGSGVSNSVQVNTTNAGAYWARISIDFVGGQFVVTKAQTGDGSSSADYNAAPVKVTWHDNSGLLGGDLYGIAEGCIVVFEGVDFQNGTLAEGAKVKFYKAVTE